MTDKKALEDILNEISSDSSDQDDSSSGQQDSQPESDNLSAEIDANSLPRIDSPQAVGTSKSVGHEEEKSSDEDKLGVSEYIADPPTLDDKSSQSGMDQQTESNLFTQAIPSQEIHRKNPFASFTTPDTHLTSIDNLLVKETKAPGNAAPVPVPPQITRPAEVSFTDRLFAKVDQFQEKLTVAVTEALKSEDGSQNNSDDPDGEAEQRPSRQKLRAYQAQAFKSFTAGTSLAEKQSKFLSDPLKKKEKQKQENDPIGEDEKSRILRIIEQEDSEDDSSSNSRESGDEAQSDNSIVSEQDFLNRSLESEGQGQSVVEAANFLRYTSDKLGKQLDVLLTVDKNERSFKQVAEKMIQQSSQLILTDSKSEVSPRLMNQKLHSEIADRFHGDVAIAQGIPYSIAALEDLIAIGCSDGSVRLFDDTEQELKVLSDKSVHGSAVTCMDIKRFASTGHIYVVSGHNKGQVAIYEIKGLLSQQQLEQGQTKQVGLFSEQMVSLFGNVSFKHQKTIEDMHKTTVIQCKFAGDLKKDIQVISCDVSGTAYISTFSQGYISFNVTKQLLMKTRLGAVYSLAPLLEYGKQLSAGPVSKFNPYQKSQTLNEEQTQLIAFGSLDEVYACQFKPKTASLLSYRRPPYVQAGSVPYLDWGLALTPSFRDKSYPVLAIAWGRSIQLVIYSNREQVANGEEEMPRLQLDGFYICEAFSIDSIFFLSESLLFIIVNKKEVRILYTQNFTPGAFDQKYFEKNLVTRKVGADMNAVEEQPSIQNFAKLKEKYAGQVSAYAEKDCGYRMIDEEIRHKDNSTGSDQRSKFNFNQTVCKNFGSSVIVLGKTQIGQRTLIRWQDYLETIMHKDPNDWLKVLRAALEIFSGKMVGLAGLPDQKEKREHLLRQHMKDLLHNNMSQCIRDFQEGEAVSQKTLRVATEFCYRVGALDYLFGDLFKMFAEGGVEQRYLENLDAFILCGKLKAHFIPSTILDRLLSLYRQKDVELLEKAILNLNLGKYSQNAEVRVLCEEEFLTSALIHLVTTDETQNDLTACLSILCSLFNLMMRAHHKKTAKDVQSLLVYLDMYGTSIFESSSSDSSKIQGLNQQQMFKKSRALKLEIEHSSTYIGYKILWIICLFLDGKKFPEGTLSPQKWRFYVMDVVRFSTNERFLKWFLNFDPDAFFTTIKKLFNEEQPSRFLKNQAAFVEEQRQSTPHIETVNTHQEILEILQKNVEQVIADEKKANQGGQTAKSESISNSFLFFLTSIARTGRIQVKRSMCLQIAEQQIQFHQCLYSLPKSKLMELVPDTVLARKVKDRTCNIYTYLIKKNEKDLIQILVAHQNSMQPPEIEALLEACMSTPLFKLKIFFMQLLGQFQNCLTQFFQIKAIKPDVFLWLNEIQSSIQESNPTSKTERQTSFFSVGGVLSRITFEGMKELITANIADFVTMNPELTVRLCDQWFDKDYMVVTEQLREQKELAFSFLNTVLTLHEQEIIAEYENFRNFNQAFSLKTKTMLLRLVEIQCDRKGKSNQQMVVDFVGRNYFPIEESLAICEQKGAVEACAVLCRRKGLYSKSIKLYMGALVQLCVTKLIHTIFVEKHTRFIDPLCTNEHMQAFDHLVQQIIKICEKYGPRQSHTEMEELWMYAIKGLFEVKLEVFRQKRALENQSDDENDSDGLQSNSSADNERKDEEAHFERFILIRKQHFMSRMSEHVNLRKVIKFLEERGHGLKYEEFRKTFEDKIENETYFITLLKSARQLVEREVLSHQLDLLEDYSRGLLNKEPVCDNCKQRLISKFDRQDFWMMPCHHVFHARCIAKTEGTCSVCFNELDAIQTFLKLRKEKKEESRRKHDQSLSHASSDFTATSRLSSLSDTGEAEDIFNVIKKRRETSLKQSIDMANKPRATRRRMETRGDKLARLMGEYDKEAAGSKLELRNFKL